ncbi:MAG: oligosaccharide flippase family protein [Candidatus Krumholzibacteriia bacterium]
MNDRRSDRVSNPPVTDLIRRLRTVAVSPPARAGYGLSIASYLQATLGLGISFYLANRLGPEQYGLLSYGLVIGTVIYTCVNFGAERTLVRDLVQSRDPHGVMTASLVLRGVLALLMLGAVGGYLAVAELESDRRLVILFCSVAAIFWAGNPVSWFDSRYQMHKQALITLAEKFVYGFMVLVTFGTRGTATIATAALFLMISRGLSQALQLFVARRTWRVESARLSAHLRWLVAGNRTIVLAALASLFISHWNQLLLEHRLSTERLGYYALAFQMIAVVTLFQNQIVRVFLPRVARIVNENSDSGMARRRLRQYAALSSLLSLALVVPLAAIAPFVLDRFFAPAYAQALAPFRVLCVWVVYYGGARLVNAFTLGLRLDRPYLWSSLAAGATAVLLGLMLVPRHGEVGVALALLFSHPVTTAAEWFFIEREFARRDARQDRSSMEVTEHA